jgi:hypothetical protein
MSESCRLSMQLPSGTRDDAMCQLRKYTVGQRLRAASDVGSSWVCDKLQVSVASALEPENTICITIVRKLLLCYQSPNYCCKFRFYPPHFHILDIRVAIILQRPLSIAPSILASESSKVPVRTPSPYNNIYVTIQRPRTHNICPD